MLLASPDCSHLHSFTIASSPSSSLRPQFPLTRVFELRSARLCTASLITSPDSFEVGKLIDSYGLMNVTSYSGYQSGMDMEFSSPGNMGRLKIQDVGEGGVKIRKFMMSLDFLHYNTVHAIKDQQSAHL